MPEIFELFEIGMIVLFGISWPISAYRSYKSRTAKGKSILFITLIFFGYIAGIISKIINPTYMARFSSKWYVLFFYVLNFLMVGLDIALYIRNYKLDKKAEENQTISAG